MESLSASGPGAIQSLDWRGCPFFWWAVRSLSKANTLEEIGDFWDNHSLADYWDQTREVEFNVRATRRHRITIDPEIYEKIMSRSHRRGVLPETLINLWLAEKLKETELLIDKNAAQPGAPADLQGKA